MSQAAVRGIALEFGKSPQLRAFREVAEVQPPRSRCALFLLSASVGRGKTAALLHACNSIRNVVWNREASPSWLILSSDYPHVPSLAEELWHKKVHCSEVRETARTCEPVLFYCSKALDRWSLAERSEFEAELKSAIEFLVELAPRETRADDPPDNVDSDRQLQLARERRDELSREERWIDAPTVHIQQGGNPDSQGINNTASRLRRRGELLGAWNGREFLHPTFQFRPDTGRLMPEVETLLAILPKDRSGWRQAFWLFQRHRELDSARPADVFQKYPEAVIKAARSDFEVSDERW